MDMVWGNNKAAADNDMAPVRGSRLCIHDRKDRTRGKPPFQMFGSVYLIPVCRYGVRTTGKKDAGYHPASFFTLSHQLNVRQSGAGTAAFSLFLPPQPVLAA